MKQQVREICIEKRKLLTKQERDKKSSVIIDAMLHLLRLEDKVGIYLPLEAEVDVSSLMFVGFELYAPRMNDDATIDFVKFENSNDLEKGKFGILEPQGNVIVDPNELDIIVIPLVGFDKERNRIGYGKGSYDRYLKNTKAFKLGVAFEIQRVEIIPTDENDVKLDCIISETMMYKG